MLGLGVLQLVQLTDEFVQNFRERVKTSNLEKTQNTTYILCLTFGNKWVSWDTTVDLHKMFGDANLVLHRQ